MEALPEKPYYVHRYRFGKQEEPMDFKTFKTLVEKAKLSTEKESFIWVCYWSGARKSEIYERRIHDCQISNSHFIIDFGQRKKHSAITPPLEFPLDYPGIEIIVRQFENAKNLKPVKKTIYFQENKIRKCRIEKANWLFPNIGSQSSWRIVKEVLGAKFYPHFLRLNMLTQTAMNDPTATVVTLKSVSGIKSLSALEKYIGVARKETAKAIASREKEWRG